MTRPLPPIDDRLPAHERPPTHERPPGHEFRGPLESIVRNPLITLLPLLLLTAAGVALGVTRDPVYTAEARVNVGRVDVPAYTLQGVTIGNATLAASYARATEAPAVINAAAKAAGIPQDEARDRIDSSHIPASTLISIEAEGDTRTQAADAANAAATGLISYVADLNGRERDAKLLRRYRRAQKKTDYQRAHLAALEAKYGSGTAEVGEARLDLLTAQLRSQSLSTKVVQTLVGTVAGPPTDNLLQLVVPADHASSDARSVLQRLALIGLAAGLLLGVALALLRENAGLLRRARA